MARKSSLSPCPPDTAASQDEVADAEVGVAAPVTWAERARQVGAREVEPAIGRELFAAVWRRRQTVVLDEQEMARFAGCLQFVQIGADQDVIVQDEPGDFMLVVLEGRLSVEHSQLGGLRTRLGVARAGDMLGDMALLDAGTRSSACTTRSPCVLAVLEAQRLETMVRDEPRLALALYSSLSRRLSLRLREVGARLSALLSPP